MSFKRLVSILSVVSTLVITSQAVARDTRRLGPPEKVKKVVTAWGREIVGGELESCRSEEQRLEVIRPVLIAMMESYAASKGIEATVGEIDEVVAWEDLLGIEESAEDFAWDDEEVLSRIRIGVTQSLANQRSRARQSVVLWKLYDFLYNRHGGHVTYYQCEDWKSFFQDWFGQVTPAENSTGWVWIPCPTDAIFAMITQAEEDGVLAFHDDEWKEAILKNRNLVLFGWKRPHFDQVDSLPDLNPFEVLPWQTEFVGAEAS